METSTRRAGLSDAKRALLEKRLRGEAPALGRREAVTRCAGEGPDFPLSFAQERMWFLSQYDPGLPIYNVPVAALVPATLDVPALERALAEVVRRHTALRTVFRMLDGQPRQVVLPPFAPPVEVRDVRGSVGPDFRAGVRRLVEEEGARPFDLETGPLLRLALLRVCDERYAMVLTTHHIATDGWAYPLILRELEDFYGAFLAGTTLSLPEPRLRYADYAVWERGYLTGETLERHLAFWREHLAGARDTEIAGDRPRPAEQSFRGAFHHFTVDLPTTEAARALARRESVTVNMVLLAAFYVLLMKYTGEDDVTIGTLLGNRARPELEEVVGFFVNTGAVRMDLSGDPTFREAVRRARRLILAADAHQELPFEKVVQALGVPRDPSRQPLFQIMYFHHVYAHASLTPRGGAPRALDAEPVYENRISLIDTGAAQFDLSMVTLETPGGLDGVVNYARDLFDEPTARRFARHFAVLLGRAVARPDEPVSRLSVLEDDERRRVLEEWARGAPASGAGEPVHRRLEEWAARTPDAPTVLAGATRWTYAELNARANRLARRLRRLGVGPETRVAVLMERSAEMVAALYAVLKAGGAYVPVDPEYPAGRVAFMLADARTPVVLTQAALAERAAAGGARVVVADAEDLAGEEAPDPDVAVDPESLAYVIYTSGSTGMPKGVGVPHRALTNHMEWMQRAFPLGPDDRVLQKTPFSFDASVWEFHAPLQAGGVLVMASPGVHRDPAALLGEVEAGGITVLQGVPTLLAVLAGEEELGRCRTLRRVFAGGEALPAALVRRLRAALPGAQVVNLYGPTETCIDATAHRASEGEAGETVPVGRPVDGTCAYVLDASLRPVPPGVPGELCVGGAQVARGYLGRPGATAERFVPDPFAGEPGARMYRTGDRARWRAGGELEFLGRTDQQVKVRGFRIEPGEVEVALRAHPGVRDCAVTAPEDARGARRLVAYVVAADGASPDPGELRRHLRERLPEPLVPSLFVALDALPLTPSGKVDRAALPAPEPAPERPAGAVLPRNHVEEVLARLWAEALGRESVGVHDNFFELGGDSILSILVLGRAAERGIRLTQRQVFLHPTIAELAAVAGTAAAAEAEQGPVAGEAPLTPVQRWFLELDLPDAHHWNQAVLLELAERAGPAALAGALEAVLAHHDALRLRFARGEDGWRQWHAPPGGPAPLEVVDLAEVPDAELASAVEARASAAQAGLDLEHGPLVRAVLFDCGPARPQRLLLVAHHLVVDAVSWRIVLEDLEAAYRSPASGEAPRLPAKTTSFRRWAERVAEHARSPDTAAEAEFWLCALRADVPPFPVDDPAASDLEGEAAAVCVELDEEHTAALLREVPAAYGTQVNDVLLAGLLRAYAAWSGRPELLVELEGHGREELFPGVDLSRTVGWFTAAYPLRLAAPAGAGPGEALKAVKERLRAVPRRGVGWGLLRWLGDDDTRRALAARPRPALSFNYLGQQGGAGEAGLFAPAAEPSGPVRSPRAPRTARVAIDGVVAGGRLRMTIFYGERAYRRETMERLADAYGRALRELVEHCRAPGAGGFTPSDFPEAGLDQEALDALMDRLAGLGG